MMMRVIFLITLAAFLFTAMVRADDSPKLPSRNPFVVLPLLKKFSSKDDYSRITQILGKEDFDIGSAFREPVFNLTDGTSIRAKVSLDGKRLFFIKYGNDSLYKIDSNPTHPPK